MASILSRLFGRSNKQSKQSRRRCAGARSRRLGVETMESRRLLAGDLGVIAGNVFVDLTDDGLDGGDTAIVGTNVHLYRDGGNGNFESGAGSAGGDDVLIGTVPTDASGNYRFEDLIAASYFVEQAAAPGQLQRPAQTVQTVTLSEADATGTQSTSIDTFNDTQTVTATAGTTNSLAQDTVEAIGGERDILVTAVGGSVTAQTNGALLNVSTPALTTGTAVVSWDGDDNDAATLAHTLSLDLTTGGGNAFNFLGGSQGTVNLVVTVFSTAGNSSTVTVLVPTTPGAGATENMTIEFTDLATATGTGADFTAVSAIQVTVDMASAASDAQFNFSQIVTPVVTTTNFANLNPMSVGNLVFNDADNSGTLNGSETGIAGVTVQLFNDVNGNNQFDSGTDTSAAADQTTDASGNYVFSNLLPGNYIAVVPISEFGAGQTLENFVTSTGNDPAPDPDAAATNNDDNGSFLASVGVVTQAITLTSGAEPTNDGDTDNNSDLTLDFGFAPSIDVGIAKVASVSTLNAGQQVTYTLTLTTGANPATNVVVTDNLPDNFTVVSAIATSGGVVNSATGNAAGEITVTYATLAANSTETITIVAAVPAAHAAGTAIANVASVTSDGLDSNLANNTSTANVDVTRSAVLQITKTDTPDPVLVGGTLTYTILVTNNGPSTATNVAISDTLPAGLTVTNVSTTTGTASETGGVVTGSVPTLAVNGTVTITVITTVAANFAGSTIANTATAQADEATQVTSTSNTAVNPQVDLAITKTDDVDPAIRGGQVVYTMVVTNNGPSAATNVEVVDTLPAGLTFVSATGGTATQPTAGQIVVAVGTIASGGNQTVTITATVAQNAAASLSNSAVVRSTESTAGFDTVTANNTATETTATQANINLAVTKSDSVDPVIAGQNLVYTLTVTNTGTSDATGVTLTDVLPDGIQINSATSTAGTVTIPASAQDTTAANPDDLTVNIGNVATTDTVTITVNATVLPGTTANLSNVASVTTTDAGMNETDTANNTATEPTTVNSQIDLAVTKTDSADPVVAGNALTYTITVTNNGPSTATNVSVSDVLPSGVTFTSSAASQGTATQASGTVTGSLGTIAPGANATVTIVVNVDEATRGSLSNTATASATETDSVTNNNSATQTTTVNASVDLAITKVDDIDPITPGSTIQYTMVVTNNGPSQATGVTLADALPANLTFVSATTTQGTTSNTGQNFSTNIGTVNSGDSVTVTVTATVSSTATGTLSNTATVSGTETDSSTANNSATQTTTIAIPGSITGRVYLDQNRNNVFDSGEAGLAGVIITLTGTDTGSNAVNRTATTNANGEYTFSNVNPGTYQLTETQPTGVLEGSANPGTGATGSTASGTNQINTITLGNAPAAVDFNFGEINSPLSKRRFLASSGPTD